MGRGWMRRFLALVALIAVAALGVWGFVEGREEAEMEALRERPVDVPLRIVNVDGADEVRFTEQDRQASGIVIAAMGDKIPKDAVVWWEGKPWVFVETAPLRFRKTALAIENFEGGFYVARGIPAGSRVVTRGAQVLLSEEQRGAVKVGEENE